MGERLVVALPMITTGKISDPIRPKYTEAVVPPHLRARAGLAPMKTLSGEERLAAEKTRIGAYTFVFLAATEKGNASASLNLITSLRDSLYLNLILAKIKAVDDSLVTRCADVYLALTEARPDLPRRVQQWSRILPDKDTRRGLRTLLRLRSAWTAFAGKPGFPFDTCLQGGMIDRRQKRGKMVSVPRFSLIITGEKLSFEASNTNCDLGKLLKKAEIEAKVSVLVGHGFTRLHADMETRIRSGSLG